MFLTFMCGCVWQLLLNQHDDDDDRDYTSEVYSSTFYDVYEYTIFTGTYIMTHKADRYIHAHTEGEIDRSVFANIVNSANICVIISGQHDEIKRYD